MFMPAEVLDDYFRPANVSEAQLDKTQEYAWQYCRDGPKSRKNLLRDPVVGVPFEFATVVDMAPLARAFRSVRCSPPLYPPLRATLSADHSRRLFGRFH